MSVLFSAYGKKIESTLTIENKSSQKIDNSTSLSALDWEENYEGINLKVRKYICLNSLI